MNHFMQAGAVIAMFSLAVVTLAAAAESEGALTTHSRQMDTLASSDQGAVAGRISSDFSTFAGSTENSQALVTGLRNGSEITLSSTDAKGVTTSTAFTPPTGKMGYGNVYTSLSLAKQQSAAAGITEPTAAQLEAALMGGAVTNSSGQTTQLTGVLELRAQGMGWGEIAHTYGYNLGPVISGMRASNAKVTAGSTTTTAISGPGSSGVHRSGIVTGAGAAGEGQGHAYGRGIVTGSGSAGVGQGGNGNAYGRGIVTGAGGMAGQAGARSGGQGKALGKGH